MLYHKFEVWCWSHFGGLVFRHSVGIWCCITIWRFGVESQFRVRCWGNSIGVLCCVTVWGLGIKSQFGGWVLSIGHSSSGV